MEMPETDAHRCRRHEGKYNPIRPAQGKRRKYTRQQNRKHIPVAGITVNRRHRTGHRESGKTCRIGNTISKKDKFPSPAGYMEMPETDAHRCRRHEGKYNPIRPAQGKRRKYTRQHISENTASHRRHHR